MASSPDPDAWLRPEELAAWRAYIVSGELLNRALDRQLQRDADIPHRWYAVLVALSEQPDRTLAIRDLSTTMNFSPSRLSHACNRMVERGWLRRETDTTDRRLVRVTLTEQGLSDLDRMARGHVAAVRRLFVEPLSSQHQLGAMQAAFEAMIDILSEADSHYLDDARRHPSD